MKGIKKTAVLLLLAFALATASTGVSAASACPGGKTCRPAASTGYFSQGAVQKACGVPLYTAKCGESLSKIASNCNTTVNNLKALNCLNGDCLHSDQALSADSNRAKNTDAENTCAQSNCTDGDYADGSCDGGNCFASICFGNFRF